MRPNETKKSINVLSLFDGISVTQLALSGLGITVENYHSSEINNNAIRLTNQHFPNTIQLGDVRTIDTSILPEITLMTFGSPCVDLSSARKNRQGLEGEKSGLFYDALRIWKEVKPKYWIMENVASMAKSERDKISAELGVQPKQINSEEYSPAMRNRLYWTNIDMRGPQKKKYFTILEHSLESGYTEKMRANCIMTKPLAQTNNGALRYLKKSFGQIVWTDKDFKELSKKRKIELLESGEVNYADVGRKMTKTELCRMQMLPDDYCDIVSYNQAHQAIGNCFTASVIRLILSFAKFD